MANRDYDGGYLPTHVAPREEFLEMASVMREFNRGSIEWTMGHALQGLGMDFLLELAKTSGRPVNWNAIIHDPSSPDTWREQLAWTERANKEAPVLPVNICMPIEFEFTLETMGLFDQLPAWNEATVGSLEERRMKLADPGRRAALKADMEEAPTVMPGENPDGEQGQLRMFRWDETFIDDVHLEKNAHLKGRTVAEMAQEQGKHPIDALLDLSVEEDLKTEFAMQGFINNDEEALTTILKHPLCLVRSLGWWRAYQIPDPGPLSDSFPDPLGARQADHDPGRGALAAVNHGGLGDWHPGPRLAARGDAGGHRGVRSGKAGCAPDGDD